MTVFSFYNIASMKRYDVPSSSSSSTSASKRQRQASSSSSSSSYSPSSSASGSGTDGTDDCGGPVTGRSELLMATLQMFPGETVGEENDPHAAANGKNTKRIEKLLKQNLCKCKRNGRQF